MTSRTRHLCLLTGMLLLLCVPRLSAQPAFVHDDAAELVSSADFDGDGRRDIALFRPTVKVWYHLRSSDGEFSAQLFGTGNEKPVPAIFIDR